MSSIPAGRAAVRTREGWFSALGVKGRRAFRAAYAGYMLDAFDLIVLTLSLSAIGATFSVGTGATGALSTVTLSASAVGGILGGVLADRIGRARTLMLSVGIYSVFPEVYRESRSRDRSGEVPLKQILSGRLLFPTRARATGGGFCYNVGRGIGALFPGIIGFLAASIGLGGAVAFGVFGYVLAIAALALLPETHGRE